MADGGEVKIKISGDSSGIEKSLDNVNNKLDKLESASTGAGGALEGAAGKGKKLSGMSFTEFNAALEVAKKAAEGIADAMKATVGQYASFEDSMLQVKATMNASEEDYIALTEAAKQAGSTTRFTASESAQALNYMALAGYDAKTSIEMLPTVLNLAQAGGGDLAATSDMLTDSLSALGLSVGYMGTFSDQLARASQKSNTSVMQLGEAILTVGGSAANLKNGTAELSTALGVLANNGIKGSEGGTHLRNMIMRLQQPTSAGTKALKKLGVTVYDAEGNMRSLEEIFGEMSVAMEGMTQQEKDIIMSDVFKVTDLAAANAMIKGMGGEYQALYAEIANATGATQDMADTMESGLAGSMRSLSSAWEGFQIQMGQSLSEDIGIQGIVDDVTGMVRQLTDALSTGGFDGLLDGIVDMIPSVTEKAGDMLADGLGKISDKLPTIMSKLTSVLPSLLSNLSKSAPQLVTGLFNGVKGLVDGLIPMLPELVPVLAEGIGNTVKAAIDSAGDLIVSAGTSLIDLIFGTDYRQRYEDSKLPEWSAQKIFRNVDRNQVETMSLSIDGKITDNISPEMQATLDTLRTNTTNFFTNVVTILTDGKPDTDAIMKSLLEGDEGFEGLYKQLAEEIEKSDLTPEQKKTQQEKLEQWYTGGTGLIASLQNKTGAELKAGLEQLEEYKNQYMKFLDEMAELSGANPVEKVSFDIVSKGAKATDTQVGEALDWVGANYSQQVQAINERRAEQERALAKAFSDGTINKEQYESAMRGVENRTNTALSSAEKEYMQNMEALYNGLFTSMSSDQKEAIENAAEILRQSNIAQEISNAFIDSGSFDLSALTPDMQQKFAEWLKSDSAAMLGLNLENMDVETIIASMSDPANSQKFMGAFESYAQDLSAQGAEAAANTDWGQVKVAMATAIEKGLFEGTSLEGVDVDELLKMLFPQFFNGKPIVAEPEVEVDPTANVKEGKTPKVTETVTADTTEAQGKIDELDGQTLNADMDITANDDKIKNSYDKWNNKTITFKAKVTGGGSISKELYARGGRATTASIFGEAGAEWAIPEKHDSNTARLLLAAMKASGFSFAELSNVSGLKTGAANAVAGVRSLMNSLQNSMLPDMEMANVNNIIMGVGAAVADGGGVTTVNLDGHQIASIQARTNSGAIAMDNKKISRGFGG